jgi:hypothetical protein
MTIYYVIAHIEITEPEARPVRSKDGVGPLLHDDGDPLPDGKGQPALVQGV